MAKMIGRTGACQWTCCARHDWGARRQVKRAERQAVAREIVREVTDCQADCPACHGPLLYWPAGDDYACADPDCVYAHGLPDWSTERWGGDEYL